MASNRSWEPSAAPAPSEERALLASIIAVQQEVATADPDPAGLMDLITSRTHQLTAADGAVIELADGDEMVYRAATGLVAPSLGLRLKIASSLSGLCVRTGEVLRCDDTESDDRVDREACRRVGVRSMVVVPLRTGGKTVGVLKVLSLRPRAFGEDTVHTLQLMTGLLAAALANARAFETERILAADRERALQASEVRFTAFMDNSPVVAFAKDASGRFAYANEAFCRTFHPDPIGRTAVAIWPKSVVSRLQKSDQDTLARGVPLESEEVIPTAEGTDRDWLVYRFPFADARHGTVLGGLALDITERKEATRSRDETLSLLNTLLESAPLGVAFLDTRFRFVRVNSTLAALHGVPVESHLGKTLAEVAPRVASVLEPVCRRVLNTGGPVGGIEFSLSESAGRRVRHLSATLYPVPAPGGGRGVGAVIADVTEHKALEAKFLQAQKMEAVGRLAGGVAHDFNNMLTVIGGYADLLMTHLDSDKHGRDLLHEIIRSGDRAAALTRQLLAFSRQQVLEPRVLNLNTVVAEVSRLLGRLLGEDVALSLSTSADLRPVRVDPQQFEQVLLNLAVNARDAMPTGGRLTIETANADVGQEYAAIPDVHPGKYVLVAVTDTGTGIPTDVLPHIFEPFFTTKAKGHGTGLGLATVEGIIRQSGGFVAVYSELGQGTIFKVYLPVVEPTAPEPVAPPPPPPARGTETVLVVEDEAAVRKVIQLTLKSNGYTVLEAGSGDEALQVAANCPGPIHLLVTDVVMPGMGGRVLAERLRSTRPGLLLLFMSGYTDDAVVRHGILEARTQFLQKPFSPTKLVAKVREILNQTPSPQPLNT